MAIDRLKENETEANRVRKLNAIVDALNALGIGDGNFILPLATDTTPGLVTIGSGLTVTDGLIATAPLPLATATTAGVVIAGTSLTVTDGTIDVDASALPLATSTTAGVVIVGTGLTVTDGTVTVP